MSQTVSQIEEDIFQVTLPLPFALNIINTYLVLGNNGWTIIDAGLNTSRCRETWEDAFDYLNIGQNDVEQIILTHVHPDHFGLAGWLQQRFTSNGRIPPVKLSATELEIVTRVWVNNQQWASFTRPYWQKLGTTEEIGDAISESAIGIRSRTLPHPTLMETIDLHRPIKIGNHSYRVLEMAGHSDGQLLFYDEKRELMFSGDHVLNKITPNISLWPYSKPDPLGEYLEGFDTLRQLTIQKALPGHKTILTHLHERLSQIEAHHTHRLDLILTAVTAQNNRPKTVQEISTFLFDQDKLSIHDMRFALTETLSHLEYLRIRGKLERLEELVIQYQPL